MHIFDCMAVCRDVPPLFFSEEPSAPAYSTVKSMTAPQTETASAASTTPTSSSSLVIPVRYQLMWRCHRWPTLPFTQAARAWAVAGVHGPQGRPPAGRPARLQTRPPAASIKQCQARQGKQAARRSVRLLFFPSEIYNWPPNFYVFTCSRISILHVKDKVLRLFYFSPLII